MDEQISQLNFESTDFEINYMKALNWIHYEVDPAKLKSELVQYATTIGKEDVADQISTTQLTVEAKIAYCLNRGAKLPEKTILRIKNFFDKDVPSIINSTPKWEEIPDSTKGKSIKAYVNCYSLIDNAKTRVLKGKLNSRELVSEVRKIIADKSGNKESIVKQLLAHYKDALVDAKTEDCTKDWVKPLITIVETIGFIAGNQNSVKTGARRAKARKISVGADKSYRKGEKAASKVNYKEEDANLGIRSIDPTNLVGASAAVVYNTKNRHCEVYIALTGTTLSVQGAKIINFDDKSSIGKTLRKPETDLSHWTRASNLRRLEVLIQNFNGKKWPLTGKLNKNCIIVKVL